MAQTVLCLVPFIQVAGRAIAESGMAADGQVGGNIGDEGPATEVLGTTGGTEAASR